MQEHTARERLRFEQSNSCFSATGAVTRVSFVLPLNQVFCREILINQLTMNESSTESTSSSDESTKGQVGKKCSQKESCSW